MATSNITHVIKDPSGTVMAGIEVIARLSRSAVRSDDSQVGRVERGVTDATGTVVLTLERTADMTPNSTYWAVEIKMPASQGGPEVHTIQVGASDQTLNDAKVSV